MPRANQLSKKVSRRRKVMKRRGVTPGTRTPQILPRSKFLQEKIVKERKAKAEIKKTKKDVEKIINDINKGKIKKLSQIPKKYQKYINVTQGELNQINKYYKEKRYNEAYNQVLRHYRKGMLWAVAAFGEGLQKSIAKKMIKQGYAASKLALERERTQRSEAIKSIRDGKIAGVKIVGNRIVGPDGKRISLTNALKKQAADEINKTLPVGDKLIIDKNYNIKGVNSGLLRQSIPYTQQGLNYYSKRLSGKIGTLAISKTKPTGKEVLKSVLTPVRKDIKITPAGNNRKKVTMPDGTTFTINSKGKVTVSANIAGEKLVFNDGFLISSGSKTISKERGSFDKFDRPKGTVFSEKTGLNSLAFSINDYRDKLRMKLQRKTINTNEYYYLVAAGFGMGIIDFVRGFTDLPETISYLARNPSQIKNIPSGLIKGINDMVWLLQYSPSEFMGYVGGSYFSFKGTNIALNKLKNAGSRTLARLNKGYLGTPKTGQTIKIKVSPRKTVSVKVVAKMPKAKLASQIKLADKKVNAISSQADDIMKLLRRQRTVRKPIPGEANFNLRTKTLLKKFDSGKITKMELYKLDTYLRAEGTKGLLERSFFADPSGKIRPSRLGVTNDKAANLLDYMSGDITFRRPKPVIYLLDDLKIEKIPRKLKTTYRKIKAGKKITNPIESANFLEWYMTKSGKAKPMGFASMESEVTLAPGEIIKKVKKVGTLVVNGKVVPIWQVKVVKPKGIIKKLLSKLDDGTITAAEKTRLKKMLRKQTGIKYSTSYSTSGGRYVNIKYIGYTSAGKLTSSVYRTKTSKRKYGSSKKSSKKYSAKSSRKVSSKSRSKAKSGKSSKKGSSKKSGRSGKSSVRRGGSSRGGSSARSGRSLPQKKPIPIRIPKGFKKKKLNKKTQVYAVLEKRGKKFIRLVPKPFILKDARDFLAYSLDNGIARTAFFVPLGTTNQVVRLPKGILGYYSKNKKKLRPYKIRYGAKKKLINGYIEKTKYALDKPGEKRTLKKRRITAKQKKILIKRLQKARRIKNNKSRRKAIPKQKKSSRKVAKRKKTKRKSAKKSVRRKKRKITPAQRKVLLARLKKARAARMRKLKKKR